MKSVAIYNASWNSFGGGEKYACSIAESLSRISNVRVRLVVDCPDISRERLSKYFNVNLDNVDHQDVRRADLRSALASADLSVIVSNFKPLGLPAKQNVYVMQIPYSALTVSRFIKRVGQGQIKEAVKDRFRRSLLDNVKRSERVLVYSEFVKQVLRQHHGISSTVLYPSIDDFQTGEPKERMVLSVGRFFSGLYNDKQYHILIDGFKRFYDRTGGNGWRYHIAGSCGHDRASQMYLASLQEAAKGYPVRFFVNMKYDELKDQYNRATLFWHATGFGVDEREEPERMEHFGMTTVEAMSAGAIPIVIDKGGQREIVTHKINGFLWQTVDELVVQSLELVQRQGNLTDVRREARRRYQDFCKEAFEKKAKEIFLPLLT